MKHPLADSTDYTPLTDEQKARLDRLQLRPSWKYWPYHRRWSCALLGPDGKLVAHARGDTDAEALDRVLDAVGA